MRRRKSPCADCEFYDQCGCDARCSSYMRKENVSVNDYETAEEQAARMEYYREWFGYYAETDDDACYF